MLPTPLRALAADLPFHLDDIDAVNATFVRWRAEGAADDARTVAVWTYCYVQRYFYVKFAGHPDAIPVDRLIDRALRSAFRSQARIRRPERYAHWVSTICKRTFLNYLRVDRIHVALSEDLPPSAGPSAPRHYDTALLRRSLGAAISTLPDFLRDIARMRLIEERSYAEIHELTGKPLPTLRAYTNKALRQLRSNATLQTLYVEMAA